MRICSEENFLCWSTLKTHLLLTGYKSLKDENDADNDDDDDDDVHHSQDDEDQGLNPHSDKK